METDLHLKSPADELGRIFDDEVHTAALTIQRGQKIYSSVRQLSELIGGEYGDRVIYELLQNAHDAHAKDQPGEIAIHVSVEGPHRGTLYVANCGRGFSFENVQAIRNIANSTKEIGEGIGNKGVGFRSIEALTTKATIYSRSGHFPADYFDGYCFRFADQIEVEQRAVQLGYVDEAQAVAAAMPRYLAAMPILEQPAEILDFARRGFATVVALSLETEDAVRLAVAQVEELMQRDAPVLLFLHRISQLEIVIGGKGGTGRRRTLSRHPGKVLKSPECLSDCKLETVTLGPDKRLWLVASRNLAPERVREAVRKSLSQEAGLKRWLEWKGDAVVSLAVPLEGVGLDSARLYNFLPMGAESASPLYAHLDAPFFTAIDRRRAKLDLPLNAELMNAAAELAAASALTLAEFHDNITPRVVVDLAAWAPEHLQRLRNAFSAAGTTLADAPVWPVLERKWSSMRGLQRWPAGKYKVFTPARAAKWGGAALLLPSLDSSRYSKVEALIKAIYWQFEPKPKDLAEWAEAVAKHLPLTSGNSAKIWGDFYTELQLAFRSADALKHLAGKAILLERNGVLVSADPNVYVRQEFGRRSRLDGPPTPPRDVARVLKVLAEQIIVKPEVFSAFERAGLWKRFDAIEILERLPNLFGEKPAPARRKAALQWAFQVWRHNTAAAKKVLRHANLHVPRRGGWETAATACFSESWTSTGRQLDAYLAEVRGIDPSAADSADTLLVSWDEWPKAGQGGKADWIAFLSDAGVTDGLVALAASFPKGPYQGSDWKWRFSYASGRVFDPQWESNHGFFGVNHPYTSYSRQGEAWYVPGQAVLHELSPDSRRRLAILALDLLERTGELYLTFCIGRFDREERHYDAKSVRTPFGTFLSYHSWVPLTGEADGEFGCLREAWLMGDRRNEPRFVPHIPEDVAEHLPPNGKAHAVLSKPEFGLRVWKDPATAVQRLTTLASWGGKLEQSDRTVFRRHYDNAWRDLLANETKSPSSLAVELATSFGELTGGPDRPKVFVRTGRDRDIARLLIETGTPVIVGSGEVDGQAIVRSLNESGKFAADLVENGDIRLLADDAAFEPAFQDVLLTDMIPWFREAVHLAHELKARELEKSITSTMIEDKLALIRVRACETIALKPSNGAPRALRHYVYRDDTRPTILVAGSFDAGQLADLAGDLGGLIHSNLRSLEPMLLRLSPRLFQDVPLFNLSPPTPEEYAQALQVELEIVQDFLLDRRNDQNRLLDLIAPFVVCYLGETEGLSVVTQLQTTARSKWLEVLEAKIPDATGLLARLRETEDIALLRRERGLNYSVFNRALATLGKPSLANVGELRRQFEVWKSELTPALLDRVRRTIRPKLALPGVLETYAQYRTLNFLTFDETWIETREVLDREVVSAYASEIADKILGPDPGGQLADREELRASNRRFIASFAKDAFRVLSALPNVAFHEAWTKGSHEVAAAVDRSGILDFEVIDREIAIDTLNLAGLWPTGVPLTLELDVLGLQPDDLDRKERERHDAEREEQRQRNSINFGGQSFDTRSDDFASAFASLADELFKKSNWRNRTRLRPVQLNIQADNDDTERRRGGGASGPSRPTVRPPEPIRAAMGLAGELLVFQYLKARHRERFNDACWVSENRASLFPEAGDPRHGFDFKVLTTETEWVYEVKATVGDACEFELTDNEYRVAALAAADRARRYRILLVQNVFDLDRCRVLELPNPAGTGRGNYRIVGRSSVRMAFEISNC